MADLAGDSPETTGTAARVGEGCRRRRGRRIRSLLDRIWPEKERGRGAEEAAPATSCSGDAAWSSGELLQRSGGSKKASEHTGFGGSGIPQASSGGEGSGVALRQGQSRVTAKRGGGEVAGGEA